MMGLFLGVAYVGMRWIVSYWFGSRRLWRFTVLLAVLLFITERGILLMTRWGERCVERDFKSAGVLLSCGGYCCC
ncbi:hypothetical protein [Bartonella harrusi]|uniref:Uncharacterized protein n=1 Tax=Bartonella harrusi TaxID=2961895 RepID=A0ABY5ERZ6_9HYPH|nr:hypothetical protein [Bartonella harrusi]UTO28169.1 hypothetical protein NMK50_08345 [Bartonella harrusi]